MSVSSVSQLLDSLFHADSVNSLDNILSWIKKRNEEVKVDISLISFNEMDKWNFDSNSSNLVHETGKFFSIEGVQVDTDWGSVLQWSQPIINQPEIGYLGIIAKEFNGVFHFLMQAKIEPGNVNCVQISPTLQATRSNFNRAHQGKSPLYLDYFQHVEKKNVLLDQLQSEQGARFLRKRNRNIIIKVDDEIPVYDDFKWMTIAQIKSLMQLDNIVNMDTRTVLSGIFVGDLLQNNFDVAGIFNFVERKELSKFGREMLLSSFSREGKDSLIGILSWLTQLKAKYDLNTQRIRLSDVKDWAITDKEIVRNDRNFFRVIGAKITIENREVSSWCQPLVEPMQEGLCAFIIKKINGVYHFLVQAKLECGNFDTFELAPTVQCLTGGYKNKNVPYLDYVLNIDKKQIIFDTLQSEEGGRFFREQNRSMLIMADDSFDEELGLTFKWITLGQLNEFLRFNNYLNIQARSILSLLNYQ